MSKGTFVDFYEVFDLDRSMSEKELKKLLGKKSVEVSQLEGSTDPNDTKTRKELQEMKKLILEAIKILGKTSSRKTYDIQLDEAVRAGNVNREKTKEIQDALERARRYFQQQKYEMALKAAQEALDNHANSEEPYEIISRSLFMMGDYKESLEAVDKGAEIFQNAVVLWWLRIRTRILMERYDEAQTLLNSAKDRFAGNAQFAAEQAYLYFHAEKYDVGKRTIEDYLKLHPSDQQYRQYTAYNLIEISNYCYKYDSESEMVLIVNQKDYDQCMQLVTLANTYYQDDYTQEALKEIKKYGEVLADEEERLKSKVYFGVGIVAVLFTVWFLLHGGSYTMVSLIVAIVAFVLKKVIDKHSYRPAWQMNRDYYRGYKDEAEGWLYNIASVPFDLAFSWLNDQ